MAQFFGREKELRTLEARFERDRFEFCVMYGRRRTGKTTLLNHFRRGRKHLYIVCQTGGMQVNLANINAALGAAFPEIGRASFASIRDALEMLFERSCREKLLLIIDEFPYLGGIDASITSVLQNLIDKYKDDAKMFLILCGSSMSYMTDKVLAYKSPLYGRRTCQIEVKPFGFFDSCRFLESFCDEEKLALYGAVGGTPMYLQEILPALSFEENMKQLFLDSSSLFYEEPLNLLNQENKSAALCLAALNAMAEGASRFNEIKNAAQFDPSTASSVMAALIGLHLARRETPFDDPNDKKTIYSISDNFFRFWFRFVSPQKSNIEGGSMTESLYRMVLEHLPEYLGPVFEDVCREYLRRRAAAGTLPAMFTSFGRWWGADKLLRKQAEIDIVGTSPNDVMLFAECKWRNAPIDAVTLKRLHELSKQFAYDRRHLMLFSKSGFTDDCRLLAERIGGVELVAFADIMREAAP